MNQQKIIQQVSQEIKKRFSEDASGHDWYHIQRVWKTSNRIASKEKKVDIFVVELAALCHELGDYKMEKDGVARHAQRTNEVLQQYKLPQGIIDCVKDIVENMSYSKNITKRQELPLEGKIVQDADRLEALGAIGISRVFAYAGSKGNAVYDPAIKPQSKARLQKVYTKAKSTAINHFYEKLLLLKNTMNTKTARRIAAHRHSFMEKFLKEFYKEWECRDF